MNWEMFNSIVQVIVTIFLGVTIILTYRQLKEATKQTKNLEYTLRTSVAQESTNYQREFWSLFFEHEDLLRWYFESRNIEASANFSENKIIFFTILKLEFYESMYLQYNTRNLSQEIWDTWRQALNLDLHNRYFLKTWKSMSYNKLYAKSFVDFVENELNRISDHDD
ncbi:MAG: hypothetical protein PVH61_22980 [Candidatus Aminicenantes bacterium]|jgi:hypothetical protein